MQILILIVVFPNGKLCAQCENALGANFPVVNSLNLADLKRIKLKCKHECFNLVNFWHTIYIWFDVIFTISKLFIAKNMLELCSFDGLCCQSTWSVYETIQNAPEISEFQNNDEAVHNHKFAREFWQQQTERQNYIAVIFSFFAFLFDLQHKYDCVKMQLFIRNLWHTKSLALINSMQYIVGNTY